MSSTLFPAPFVRAVLLIAILTSVAFPVFSQATAIEPCPATPKLAPGASSTKVELRARQTLVDSSIADDREVERILAPYTEKVRALSVVIGRLDGELKKTGVGAGSLGNFVTDGMLAQATKKTGKPITLAIMNAGGLRKNEISPGQLRASDIFELLPFENALITVDFTGVQLLKLLQIGTRDAQAGAKIQFKYNDQSRTEFLSGKLLSNGREEEVDPNKTYTIVTIDYLINLGSGSYAILQEGTNKTPLNMTLRDAIMDFVKSETAAGRVIKARTDDRFVQVGPGPARSETPND
jgi:2',3'-cyclic-nucleotide 2'-phosphodiesterase (5'-nucleotidase family)